MAPRRARVWCRLAAVALALAPPAHRAAEGGSESGADARWSTDAERAALCDGAAHPYPPHSRRPVRWVHVPKTGTSFMNTVWHYACSLPPTASASDFSAMYEKHFAQRFPPAEHCARLMLDHSPATHKPIGDGEWAAHAGAFVTMLRAPSTRLVSAFKHGRHCIQDCSPEMRNAPPCTAVRDARRLNKCRALRRATGLREYAEQPAALGCAARMLVGRACNEPLALRANESRAAAARLGSVGFGFVGLVEEWNLSVCLFHRLLGGTPRPQEFSAVRVNKQTTIIFRRHPDLARALRDPADELLYAVATRRFRRQVRAVLAKFAR